jgi:hypothetical protein
MFDELAHTKPKPAYVTESNSLRFGLEPLKRQMTWLHRECNWGSQSALLLVRDANGYECRTAIE